MANVLEHQPQNIAFVNHPLRKPSANAALQRNNVEWLDANGDGVLDKSDPAFAAIKLWVEVRPEAWEICDFFESSSRTLHQGQSPFSHTAANANRLEMYA